MAACLQWLMRVRDGVCWWKVWLITKPCLHITEYPQIIVGLPAKEGRVRFGISVKEAP